MDAESTFSSKDGERGSPTRRTTPNPARASVISLAHRAFSAAEPCRKAAKSTRAMRVDEGEDGEEEAAFMTLDELLVLTEFLFILYFVQISIFH